VFPLLRYFSVTSMVAILATSFLLAGLHHLAERDQLLDLGEGNHAALAQTFANALLPSYRVLAETTRSLDDAGLRAHPLVGDMRPRVIGAMQNTRVVKVKIYDRDGRTVFSTDPAQIGKNYATNAGFQSALHGKPLSELTHRDRFSAFDREIVDRDVLSSYVALRSAPEAPIEGVLEVYSDVTEWVSHIDRQARMVALATVVALSLLYAVLFVIVRRADRLIRTQYEQLRRSEAELAIAATVFESEEPMLVADHQARIIRVNRALVDCTGFTFEELWESGLDKIVMAGKDPGFVQSLRERVAREGVWRGELLGHRKRGNDYPLWLTLTAVRNGAGEVTNYVGTLTDITERSRAEERIRTLAFYDQLTGLANRTLLRDRLMHALAMGSRSGRHGALLFIDLDHFKEVNDTLGHEAGDSLLKEVGRRLQESVRQCDTVSRWGGDEFIVMLESLDSSEEVATGQLREVGGKILATMNQPFRIGELACPVTSSIGATLFRDPGQSLDHLLKRADDAMYRAKNEGRNRLRVYGQA
jgi:diguanylate cyclase (GGDEF)-like protein/PAS domain S-box-containing protein